MIISVLNPKGGAGKSTVATNLADAYYRDAKRVLLVDSDPQGSARDWQAVNPNNMIEVVGIDRPELFKTLPRTAENYEIVIVDGAAKLENMLIAAIKVSDIVIIPVQPSPFDIWSLHQQLIPFIQARLELAAKPYPLFLISRAIENTILGRDALEALKEVEFELFDTVIHNLQAYPQAVKEGVSVMEGSNKKAIQEVLSLYAELNNFIERLS